MSVIAKGTADFLEGTRLIERKVCIYYMIDDAEQPLERLFDARGARNGHPTPKLFVNDVFDSGDF